MSITRFYDAVTISNIPSGAEAVAGYIDGRYANFRELVARFPHAKHISISVQGHDADAIDCEPGDVSIGSVPGWIDRQLARGVHRPIVYADADHWYNQGLLRLLSNYGSRIRRWIAHYDGSPVIPGGFDAKQFATNGVDINSCLASFFDSPAPARKKPTGIATFAGSFNTNGAWKIHGTSKGDFRTGTQGGKAAAYVTFDEVNGKWVIKPRPWARKPKIRFALTQLAQPRGTAEFAGSFNTGDGHWKIWGTHGTFREGTKGGKAAAYITFDESSGRWNIQGRPWARNPLRVVWNRLTGK